MDKFYLTGIICEYTIQELCDYINNNQEQDSLTIYIDSPGGNVFDGLRAIKAIENSKIPVMAECGVVVASIAAIIALSCHSIKVNKDTFMMVHKPWVEMSGNAEELLATASLLEQAGTSIINVVKNKAKDESLVEEWFNSPEKWFGCQAILDNFNDVSLDEEMDINTNVIQIGDILKKAPKELLTLVAQLKEEPDKEPEQADDKEPEKEPEQEPEKDDDNKEQDKDNESVDNVFAKEVLAKLDKINIL